MNRCLQIIAAYFVCSLLHCATAQPNLRVSAQFVEISQNTLLELLNDKGNTSHNLYEKIMALPKEEQGKIIETAVVTTANGLRQTVETHLEMIYPTATIPPQIPSNAGYIPDETPFSQFSPLPLSRPNFVCPVEFETRYCGTRFEVSAAKRKGDDRCDVEFVLDASRLLKFDVIAAYKDQWGDASYRRPIFDVWRHQSTLIPLMGKFELVTTLTPQNNRPIPAPLTKVLVFVRCDFVQ